MKILSTLFLAMLLFACGERPTATTDDMDTTDEMETTMPDRQNPVNDMDDMDDMDMTSTAAGEQTLQSTVSAVESAGGDITALAPATAVSNIDTWISTLSGMDGTDQLVSDLNSLKTELTAETVDGPAVSELLSNLASETREVGNGNAGLNALASALDAGAAKLGGK